MKKYCLLFTLIFYHSIFAFDASHIPQFRQIQSHIQEILLNEKGSMHKLTSEQTLYIGFNDPDEIVRFTGPHLIMGDIMIANQGQLIIEDSDFELNGNLTVINEGMVKISNSNLTIHQEYIYEHNALLIGQAQIVFDNVNFKAFGQSWTLALAESASWTAKNSEISDGYITTALMHQSSAEIDSTIMPGEFLCMGENELSFKNCDDILFWVCCSKKSTLDATLPDDSLIVSWEFPQHATSSSGFEYHVTMDSCTDVKWGLISRSGSEATFRDTHFRVAGLMFNNPDSIAVKNLVNGAKHVNDLIDVEDRQLRMINTDVATWNFYGSEQSHVSIHNSIFGEVLAMDTSKVYIDKCICDGSGGYTGVDGHAQLIITRSLIQSQVIAKQSGVCIGAYSSFSGSEIDTDSLAIMGIFNTTMWVEPEAHAASTIFNVQLPYIEGYVDEEIPIIGTAEMINGPRSPLIMSGYRMEYRDSEKSQKWQMITDKHSNGIVDDVLGLWDTRGLESGYYEYQLNFLYNFDDTLSIQSAARLEVNPYQEANSEDLDIKSTPMEFALYQNHPNPFNPETIIHYSIPEESDVVIHIYNQSGQIVNTLVNSRQIPGHYSVNWNGQDETGNPLAAGVYLYYIKAADFEKIIKMILVK